MKDIIRFLSIAVPAVLIANLYTAIFGVATEKVYVFFLAGFGAMIVSLWDEMMKND